MTYKYMCVWVEGVSTCLSVTYKYMCVWVEGVSMCACPGQTSRYTCVCGWVERVFVCDLSTCLGTAVLYAHS